jgi:hypothetical protein
MTTPAPTSGGRVVIVFAKGLMCAAYDAHTASAEPQLGPK